MVWINQSQANNIEEAIKSFFSRIGFDVAYTDNRIYRKGGNLFLRIEGKIGGSYSDSEIANVTDEFFSSEELSSILSSFSQYEIAIFDIYFDYDVIGSDDDYSSYYFYVLFNERGQ